MKVMMMEQGSDTWFEARKGILTASRMDKILTPKTLKPSASQDDLIDELIGEMLSLIPPEGVENFTSRAIRWGQQCEAEARSYFAMETGYVAQKVGFCLGDDGRLGCSPDALLGYTPEELASGILAAKPECAALELKCPQANTQAKYVRAGTLPSEYRCQCHGHLIVTGLPVCWFLSYSPGLPPLLLKVERDEFTDMLAKELDRFYERFMAELAKFAPADQSECLSF